MDQRISIRETFNQRFKTIISYQLFASVEKISKPELPPKKLFPYNIIIFIIFCLENYLQGAFITSYSSIMDIICKCYNVDISNINLCSSLMCISFIIFSIPSSFYGKKHGIRSALILSLFLMTIGSGIRLLINYSFYFNYLGFFLIGAGNPLLLNSKLKMVKTWFSDKFKNIAIGIFTICGPIGAGTGILIPLFFVDTDDSIQEQKEDVFNYLLFMTFLSLFLLIMNIIFIKDQRTDKTKNLLLDQKKFKEDFKKDLIYLLKSKNFMAASLIYGISLSIINFNGNNLIVMLNIFEINKTIGLITIVICIFSGIFGSIFYGLFFIGKFQSKNNLKQIFTLSIISLILIFYAVMNKNKFLIYFGCCILGFVNFAQVNVIFDYCVKKFPKINPFAINTFLVLFESLFQSITMFLLGLLLDFNSKFYISIIILIFQIMTVFSYFLSNLIK